MTNTIPPRGRPIGVASVTFAMLIFLSGCSTLQPPPRLTENPQVPQQWSASRPDTTRSLELQHWWTSQNEPELVQLIDAAQKVSPNVATALARIEQSKAFQAQAVAALVPALSASASSSKMHAPLYGGTYTQNQAGVQISWALDMASLSGVNTASARAHIESAEAQWHDARILVAAEIADLYYASRTCRQQLALSEKNAASFSESEQLTRLSLQAGMASNSTLATARTYAAESRARLQQQQAICEIQIKGLVALTAKSEADLLKLLQPAWSRESTPTPFAISAIPAQTLVQRPDIYMAEREVLQAQAKVLQAESARLPRLSLEGFVGNGNFVYAGKTTNAPTWTFGPLALTLPIFDAGKRAADQRAAEADLQAALVTYQARVRQGVREVEEALVQLDSIEQRWLESRTVSEQSRIILEANQRLLQQGMINRLELEDSQRQLWSADSTARTLDLERQRAWITLYRAVGGGFYPSTPSA
jgi:multidrug efflux system outer membrane protein